MIKIKYNNQENFEEPSKPTEGELKDRESCLRSMAKRS